METTFWTDSMIVLTWITKKEPWATFVGNRVTEIRDKSDVSEWCFVPGKDNPADLPSRGCTFKTLRIEEWWNGPQWLWDDRKRWPQEQIENEEEAYSEKKTSVVSCCLSASSGAFSEILVRNISKYQKIVRVCAQILRMFQNRSKEIGEKANGPLAAFELEQAEVRIFLIVQKESIEELENYKNMKLFKDEKGLLRVKTKLLLGDYEAGFKEPVALKGHPFVRKLIEDTRLFHAGVQTTLSCIREKVWIIQGNKLIKSVLSKCLVCKRARAKAIQVEDAPLPKDRITHTAAFEIAGCDLAGPIFLRGNQKAWVVLFTCAVYRGVHFELVSSLSTEAFLQALRRFFARRGRSRVIYSDNGTNFVGAGRALRTLDWNLITDRTSLERIVWKFSPPAAPWWGGFWERMAGLMKVLLRKNLGRACVTYEEMITLLCDCESVINARPLTYLYESDEELQPLTPAHFLRDLVSSGVHDVDVLDRAGLLKRAAYMQRVRESLRSRFKEEYLGALVVRAGSHKRTLKVGEVVLVGSDNSKRVAWPMAKVVELFDGKDGVHRVARLKLAQGELIRPVQRLYPFEIEVVEDLELGNRSHSDSDIPNVEQDELIDDLCELAEDDLDRSIVPVEPIITTRGRRVKPRVRLDL